MALKFYNTLSRRKETFEPVSPPHVGLYTCGPTVYDYAHIGNFRAYVFEDLLRRVLRFRGFSVVQVMNLTDVDDKTIRGSRAEGMPLSDYTRKYKDAFFNDLNALTIEQAEHYPAAADHVPDMIRLIERLLAGGFAYRSEDGSIYFSIAGFPAYGKLARLDMSGLQPGARVSQDEYKKENAADFALWKAWSEDDGDVWWDSPWGRGRPGWHIECSAMSMKYLGESLDIHTGGVDNIFPHHEDEIAQSEAATGKPFVKYWIHCGYLLVNERKMSKSEGNFFTLRDLFERGFSGREIRYVLISTHYRQSLNFTFDGLKSARGALRRLDEFSERTRCIAASSPAADGEAGAGKWVERARTIFHEALDDDLNSARALAAVFDMAHEGNRRIDSGAMTGAEASAVQAALDDFEKIFGISCGLDKEAPPELVALAHERQAARQAKRWDEADRLRSEIAGRGWIVQDMSDGFRITPAGVSE